MASQGFQPVVQGMAPVLSPHFAACQPSAIRLAQIEYLKRRDGTRAANVAIGNVSLPMHPAMQERMRHLGDQESPFRDGIVQYSETVGREETRQAFLNVLAASGCPVAELSVQVTDGGSHAMELVVLGVCGPAGSNERPLLVLDPTYANYRSMAARTGRSVVAVARTLQADGTFELPDLKEIEQVVRRERPGALLIIPYDNPTGQFLDQERLVELARMGVRHNLWLVSDESYRELFYTGGPLVSVWTLSEEQVPGITGRRIGLETASKVWNACGLRIGGLITDNPEFHARAVAENTANLCANVIGQYIFGALAHESREALQAWFSRQREYYRRLMDELATDFRRELPGAILSRPAASIYSVIDVREVVRPGFNARDFVLFCAREGRVDVDGQPWTLLVSPVGGFYDRGSGLGATQMRIACVEPGEVMSRVPRLFAELLRQYEAARAAGA